MVEIGGRPILWQIMRIYAHYGYDEFVVALGSKGDYIKMLEYSTLQGDLDRLAKDGQVPLLEGEREDWTVALVDTGLATETGYEHVSYFSPGSLARLFRATGFEPLVLELEYDDQYILIEARPGDGGRAQPLEKSRPMNPVYLEEIDGALSELGVEARLEPV